MNKLFLFTSLFQLDISSHDNVGVICIWNKFAVKMHVLQCRLQTGHKRKACICLIMEFWRLESWSRGDVSRCYFQSLGLGLEA